MIQHKPIPIIVIMKAVLDQPSLCKLLESALRLYNAVADDKCFTIERVKLIRFP